MKVAITGHTSGLGLALYSKLDDVIGFSRSNGYDINNFEQILDESMGCDIFVNNAHSGFKQVGLLQALYARWKNRDKLIINISSNAPEFVSSNINSYAVEKAALDKATRMLYNRPDNCKVMLVKPGYIDTPRVSQVRTRIKIAPDDLAEQLIDLMKKRKSSIWVTEIVLYPRTKL